MTATRCTIPPVQDLTYTQYRGWACVWCGTSLADAPDAILVGKSRGTQGAVVLDTDVYACSTHPKGLTR